MFWKPDTREIAQQIEQANNRTVAALSRAERAERRLINAQASLADEQRRHRETQATLERLLADIDTGTLRIPNGALL